MTTEMAKGKTLEEAMKITRADVADSLGWFASDQMHCSNLAADAFTRSNKRLYQKTGSGHEVKK